jgi:hypothetical protein
MILLRLFKNNRSAGMAVVILLSLAIFIKSLIRPGEFGSFTAMPFYNLLFSSIHKVPVIDGIIALILLLILCYMLIRIGVRNVLLEFRSFMPALFFILFSMALPSAQQVNPILVGSLFYLLCFAILFEVYDKPPDTFTVFTAGLVLAFGSMFYLVPAPDLDLAGHHAAGHLAGAPLPCDCLSPPGFVPFHLVLGRPG